MRESQACESRASRSSTDMAAVNVTLTVACTSEAQRGYPGHTRWMPLADDPDQIDKQALQERTPETCASLLFDKPLLGSRLFTIVC